jgi:P27 family predicted phage terminase small subunit
MRGRRPKPTALHRLQGTFNVTDHRGRAFEPVAEGELREPPDDLTPTQRDAWVYAIENAPPGVLYRIDCEVLRAWVETVDRRREAQQILETEISPALWATSPCHGIINRTTALLVRLAAELGFSPASRPRIHVNPPAEPETADNPWTILKVIDGGRT